MRISCENEVSYVREIELEGNLLLFAGLFQSVLERAQNDSHSK